MPNLDRFNDEAFRYYDFRLNVLPGSFDGDICDICGEPAHYRFDGLVGKYCRGCRKEVQSELKLTDEEVVRL